MKVMSFGIIAFSALLYSNTFAQTGDAKWFAGAGTGKLATGGCIEVMSAGEIARLAEQGVTTIISEKSSGGKVVEMTWSLQGRTWTIYREKSKCEAEAEGIKNRQNTVQDKYK
jgi:hypothetical protein